MLGGEHDLPVSDTMEPNDNADTPGASAHPFGPPRTIVATLDYWDDPIDVYSIKLTQGSQVFGRLSQAGPGTKLVLWKPGTTDVTVPMRELLGDRAAQSQAVSGQQRLGYRVPATGTYYLEVKVGSPMRAPDVYRLAVAVKK
jgi:hypothetical protein